MQKTFFFRLFVLRRVYSTAEQLPGWKRDWRALIISAPTCSATIQGAWSWCVVESIDRADNADYHLSRFHCGYGLVRQ
jgi:hypothetical protein